MVLAVALSGRQTALAVQTVAAQTVALAVERPPAFAVAVEIAAAVVVVVVVGVVVFEPFAR